MNAPLPRPQQSGSLPPRWTLWPKLAVRELRNNLRFSVFFVVNLALGLAGFIALDSFQVSLDRHLARNSKAILTADLSLSSNTPFEPEVLNRLRTLLPEDHRETRRVAFFTMVAGADRSRLVQLIAVDEGFPFYGGLRLAHKGVADADWVRRELLEGGKLWAYPELLNALGLEVGEQLQIGDREFEIAAAITEDASSAFNSFGVAPRVYIGLSQVESTGLLTTKSRIRFQRLYWLPEDTDLEHLSQQLQQEIRNLSGETSRIRVQTHDGASENLGRVLGYLNDYLGLIALIALFLASIGAAYLFRSYLRQRFREMAILMSLGAQRSETVQVVLWQLGLLGTAAALVAIVGAVLILPALPWLLAEFLPPGFETSFNLRNLGLAFVMGSLGSIAFCLPVLTRLQLVQPLSLFHEHLGLRSVGGRWRFRDVGAYLPLIFVYWGLAVWQAQSWIVGSAFIGMLFGSILVLGLLGWGLLSLLQLAGPSFGTMGRLAFRNLSRNRLGSISCFLAIAVGTLLINLVPQIHNGLQEEVARPEGVKVPSLFLFDIQPEQVDPVQGMLAQHGTALDHLSPLVRARLEAVNGTPFRTELDGQVLTREQEGDRRFRSRGINLSYRTALSNSERIVSGRPLAASYDPLSSEPPELSLEERFASRLGLRLGDLLTFDVLGVPVEGRVVNFRQVKWNSFQPNFFILFQPGVLEEAPASFLGSISRLDDQQRLTIQNIVVQEFPNVSVIDVTRIVTRILQISDQMSLAIRMMAWLSILVGLVVVYSIARHEVQTRQWELNLLKVLGARFQDVRTLVLLEFGLLGFFAALFGLLLSLAMSYALAWQFFGRLWMLAWEVSVASVIGVSLLSMGVALLAASGTLRQKPLALLRAV